MFDQGLVVLFDSFQFLVFFPLVVIAYYAMPHRWRWVLLLSSSYYFYACWKLEYLSLIIISTLIDYYAGWAIYYSSRLSQKRLFLGFSLCTNLGILFSFKYANFFGASLNQVFSSVNVFYQIPQFEWLLPVGISFYTFQSMSYSIDIYRGERKPEKHLGIFASYVAFFPQLVAGPIERSTRLIPQFWTRHDFSAEKAASGFNLMAWGFLQKVVIADRLAVYVNQVFNSPSQYYGLSVLVAAYFFAFQIYCDFAGYTNIARGASRILGFELMKNFEQPYFSTSIAEFWRRWHISLSTWFRDYVYIPLGGNRCSQTRCFVNVLVVFLLSGLWHGANWTFIVWGLLHGLAMIAALALAKFTKGIPSAVKWLGTFHLVVFAWIFFRANSFGDAVTLIQNLFSGHGLSMQAARLGAAQFDLSLLLGLLSLLGLVDYFQYRKVSVRLAASVPRWVYWGAVQAILLFIFFLQPLDKSQFIYFQF